MPILHNNFVFEFKQSNETSLKETLMNTGVPITRLLTQVGKKHDTPDAHSSSGVGRFYYGTCISILEDGCTQSRHTLLLIGNLM